MGKVLKIQETRMNPPIYRSIRAFSKTVPDVRETTGTVGGEPETEHQ